MRQVRGSGATRANALWGGGKRVTQLVLATVLVVAAVMAGRVDVATAGREPIFVTPGLLDAAAASPRGLFDVIVSARKGKRTADAAADVQSVQEEAQASSSRLKRRFQALQGVSAKLSGQQIVRLAKRRWVASIVDDRPVTMMASNRWLWPTAVGATQNWASGPAASAFPTIAIVDSGVQSGRTADFGSRLLAQVNLVSSTTPNEPGDGRGHGTLVASIAASSADGFTGAEPRANLVSLDVLDDAGGGRVSDLIAACDWILANRTAYNIRVANFSLNAGSPGTPFQYDPLDQAVEQLWLNGVTVVVAAGNYGTSASQPSGVVFAPANDPFVITVGASGTGRLPGVQDDTAAPWSAWGYTNEGFLKPDVAAPGRWMRGAVPETSAMKAQFPGRSAGAGYMWMSGTSFAAPVVSGLAANILAQHPDWTPDQVKGALMLSARAPAGYAAGGALGVGIVYGPTAVASAGLADPNAALRQFVEVDAATGRRVFAAERWETAAAGNASWASASWASASWASASWASASWASASWASASWASASWASASWASASWASASWANNASSEPDPDE